MSMAGAPGEAVEEKISLSGEFRPVGLTFYPFSQDEVPDIVAHWLQLPGRATKSPPPPEVLQWALMRARVPGRALQFARDHAGRLRTTRDDARKPGGVAAGVLPRGRLLPARPARRIRCMRATGSSRGKGRAWRGAQRRLWSANSTRNSSIRGPRLAVPSEHLYEHAHRRLQFHEVAAWGASSPTRCQRPPGASRGFRARADAARQRTDPEGRACRTMGITQAAEIGVEVQLGRVSGAMRSLAVCAWCRCARRRCPMLQCEAFARAALARAGAWRVS